MRRASTMQNLLIAILLAAHAGTAYAAEGPFIPIDLGTLGGVCSLPFAVNASGQVVGGSSTPGNGPIHGFFWTATGGMVDLGTLGGSASDAVALNASGQVVGGSRTPGNIPGSPHAFS